MSDKTRNLRYKRPALASMGAYNITQELDDIVEACNGVRYYIEQADNDETLLNALDGDEDAEWEFRMAFADLSAKADELQMRLYEQDFEDFYRDFDDATVDLIGNRYELVGYDSEEEDYFSLTSYEQGLAQTEDGKRLCRLTKAEMLSRIGWALGILLAFFDLRQQYDYLKATFDILRDENSSLLDTIARRASGSGVARMRKREYSQISFDDLLGVPTAGEIVESHGRRLSYDEAAARIGEIIILNISTENHEWFRAVRVLKAVVTPDGERRLICERGKGLCYLRDGPSC